MGMLHKLVTFMHWLTADCTACLLSEMWQISCHLFIYIIYSCHCRSNCWTSCSGGSNPYWLGCDYPLFTGFLIANGIAFIMSVAAVVVITAFPLVLSRTPHQAAWWGGILLMISLLAFILAFLLAGFVTVNYNAPPASCSNLQCTQGGIKCSFSISLVSEYAPDLNSSAIVYTGDADSTFFVMDANVAGLNSVSNSSRGAVCLTYNRSVSNGPMSSTLYPWAPTPSDQGGSNLPSQQAIQQLLTDPTVQRQTVCMDVSDFPSAIDPALSLNSFAVDVNFDIQDLGDYLNVNDVDVKTILPNNSAVNLHSFSILQYFCLHQTAQESMRFDVLCDTASQTETGNFSITQSGNYISAITAANSGAVLFDANITAVQVSRAIKALAGCFSCICLVITVFLVKSKWF